MWWISRDNSKRDKMNTQTTKSFEDKWNRNKNYMNQVKEFQERWYLKRYGFTEKTFKEFIKNKKRTLEAGCGVGKDTGLFARNTKGLVYAVDISNSTVRLCDVLILFVSLLTLH